MANDAGLELLTMSSGRRQGGCGCMYSIFQRMLARNKIELQTFLVDASGCALNIN